MGLTSRKGARERRPGPLTTADLIVLSLLEERAMHGYELLGEYERQEVADWASVSKAQVYYALQKLAELKLIAPRERPIDDDRERTVYRPTPEGRQALREGLAGAAWARSRVAQPFATWLGLSIHLPPEDVARMIAARRVFLVAEIERERASLGYIATLPSTRARAGEQVVRLVIAQLEAELAWLSTIAQ